MRPQRPLHSSYLPARPPWWIRAVDLIAGALLALALVSIITGGTRISLGGLVLSVTKPQRALVEASVILLIRAVIWRGPGAAGRLPLILILAVFMVGLVSDSTPRRVGDAGEYMVMAMSLGRCSGPAVAASDIDKFSYSAWAHDYWFTMASPGPRGQDTRQDFFHFWFYPLLAAPFVRLAEAAGVHPNYGFAALNVLLLLATTWVLSRRLDVASMLLLVTGPILWWLDKAHTEVFTFSLLAVGLTLLKDSPWWTMVMFGAAATQNPPFVAALLLTLAWALFVQRRRDLRVWVGAAAGIALALLHPLYYALRLGIWSPLRLAVVPHLPGVAELTAVLWDPNLGILVFTPVFTLTIVVGLAALVVRTRAHPACPEVWFAALLGLFFLFSFAQTGNANSGATFNPSRYGLWLLPLAVPVLVRINEVWGADRTRWLRVASVLALVYASLMFQPRFSENYVKPSRPARWLWTAHPSFDNPLPEVFCERVSGRDGEAVLPIATPGCEKALLAGAGLGEVAWPPQCRPEPVPAECARPGALCYANRAASGYTFARAPSQPAFSYALKGSGLILPDYRNEFHFCNSAKSVPTPSSCQDGGNLAKLGTGILNTTGSWYVMSSRTLDPSAVLEALKAIKDPDLHRDIVTLGFVKNLEVDRGLVKFTIELTTPACPVKDQMREEARAAVLGLPGVTGVEITMTANVRTARGPETSAQPIPGVRNVIAVGAGKGGVGKTTVAVNLAVALAREGSRVGMIDGDVYGPNVPIMMGLHQPLSSDGEKILPAERHGIKVVSMGFLTTDDSPVIWRGPMLHSVIRQFFQDVRWGELDYLVVDMPPGTGDVALSLSQTVPVAGAIVVTTPQQVSLADSRRAVRMYQKLNIPILGLIENMSYFVCPACRHESDIFGRGGGERTAEEMGVPFLGRIPIYEPIRVGSDSGQPLVIGEPDSHAARAFMAVAEQTAAQVSIASFGKRTIHVTPVA